MRWWPSLLFLLFIGSSARPHPQAHRTSYRLHPSQVPLDAPESVDSVQSASQFFDFKYYGGPLITKPKVVTIFMGENVAFESQILSFYKGILNSSYMDWLSEYSTNRYTLGAHGTLIANYSDPTVRGTLSDEQIQNLILGYINAGYVPLPNANTIYTLHFSPGISILMNGHLSCNYFCAYHSCFTVTTGFVYYTVVPDQGGLCATCGPFTQWGNTAVSASHEIMETITDGAAQHRGSLGWYDVPDNQELADVCGNQNSQLSTPTGVWLVQNIWSMKYQRCVAEGATVSLAPVANVHYPLATTFTVTITPSYITHGVLSFYNHQNVLMGRVTLGTTTYKIVNQQVVVVWNYKGNTGLYSVTVNYTDSIFPPRVSGPQAFQILKAASSLSLAMTPTTLVPKQLVHFTLHLQTQKGAAPYQDIVRVLINGVQIFNKVIVVPGTKFQAIAQTITFQSSTCFPLAGNYQVEALSLPSKNYASKLVTKNVTVQGLTTQAPPTPTPTSQPTAAPTTPSPTSQPTAAPTDAPTSIPTTTESTTLEPTTLEPTTLESTTLEPTTSTPNATITPEPTLTPDATTPEPTLPAGN